MLIVSDKPCDPMRNFYIIFIALLCTNTSENPDG